MERTHTEPKGRTAGEITRAATEGPAREMDRDHDEAAVIRVRSELEEYDLPELADTIEDADARAAADRYLGAMRGVQKEWGANEDEYKVLTAFQRQRHDERQGALERQLYWLRGTVKALFAFMTLRGKKSLNLIGGRVGTRAKQDELVVDDDDAVIAWAKLHGVDGIIRHKPSIDRKALRAYMEKKVAQMIAPPGVRLEERDDEFFATPATD